MYSRKRNKQRILPGPEEEWIPSKQPKKYRKVDPLTGEPCRGPNAINRKSFNGRKRVDPVTGLPSQEPNAITRNQFQNWRLVDPITGEPSEAENAIRHVTFKWRRRVDPRTGQPSEKPDAIRYSTFYSRRRPKRSRKSRAAASEAELSAQATTPSETPNAIIQSPNQVTDNSFGFWQRSYAEYIPPPHADAPLEDGAQQAEPALPQVDTRGLQVLSIFAPNQQAAAEEDQNLNNFIFGL